MDKELLQGSKNPVNVAKSLKYDIDFSKRYPNYFKPEGIMIFCGSQGSGKTLSAVQYVKKVVEMYPAWKLVTNVDIAGLPEYTEVM